MNGYSLVIDISSDEDNNRCSTPLKTLPLNTVSTLSDSSTEVFRGSEAETNSTSESDCSPKRRGPTPSKKKKLGRVSFNLPPAVNPNSDTDFYEEPDTPPSQPQTKPTPVLKEKANIPQLGNEKAPNTVKLNDLNEPSLAELDALHGLDIEDRQFFATVSRGRTHYGAKENAPPPTKREQCRCALSDPTKPPEICPIESARREQELREMEEEERLITKMTSGRGRGRGTRIFNGRPPVIIRKEIPHCRAIPLSLASRGALSRPAPGRDYSCCSGIPGFGIDRGQGRGKLY